MLFKKKAQPRESVEVTCRNCQTHFKGKFCPECGQPVDEHDRPFSILIYDFLGDFIAFDSRFYKTFIYLVKRPGFLSNEYFDGRQIRYSPPIKVFIFASFIFFFLFQVQTNKSLSEALENESQTRVSQKTNPANPVIIDSTISETSVKINSDSTDIKINLNNLNNGGNLKSSLSLIADKLEKDLVKSDNPRKRQKLQTFINLCRVPEQAIERILKYVSWAFFLLLPIFALILKLFYIRRKQNYIRHLVFSIHLHSFWFLTMVLFIILNLIFGSMNDWISFAFFLLCGVYFVAALKEFYHQKLPKTILKFFGISILYFFVMTIVVGMAMLNALSLI